MEAASLLSTYRSDIRLARVDTSRYRQLAKRLEKNGKEAIFPPFIFFNNKTQQQYTGGIRANGIAHWLKRVSGKLTVNIETDQQLKRFKVDHQVAIFGLFRVA